MVRFTVNIGKPLLEKVYAALSPEQIDGVVERVALRSFRSSVEATPKKWFGQVRAGWKIERPAPGRRLLINGNKIMGWIEEGTRDHGPVTAKSLYIPLTRQAAFGWQPGFVFGRDYILCKRVKGIEARHIAQKQAELAKDDLKQSMKDHIRQALAAA